MAGCWLIGCGVVAALRSQHRHLAPLPAPLALCLGSLRVPPQPSYMGTHLRRAEVEHFKIADI